MADDHAQLFARDEICQLMMRYGQGVDFRDGALLAAVFADPFEFDVSAFNGLPAATISPTRFVETTFQVLNGLKTLHQITNPRIKVSGDAAQGLFNMAAFHHRPAAGGASGGIEYVMYGFYSESFRRLEGRWTIERHHLLKAYCSGDPQIFAG